MKDLIQEFSELSKAKITKVKLPDVQQAITDGTDLLATLEPAEPTDDGIEEFDDAVSELESALDDAQMACDDFENAEEKDERDEALDSLDSALSEIHTALKTLDGVATVSAISYDDVREQIIEDFKKQVQSQQGKNDEPLKVWLAAADKPEWRYKRLRFIKELMAVIQNESKASQKQPGTP